MEHKIHEFKVGDAVRIVTAGPGSGHMLRRNEIVKIVRLEGLDSFTVQASGKKAFRNNDSGWSRDSLGHHLQHLDKDDVEAAYAAPASEIALSNEPLPFI